MSRRSVTRREVLQLGAGAAALTLVPSRALAASCELPCFELALEDAAGRARIASAGWRTLPVTRAPRRFDLMGLRWRAGRHVHAQIRTRTRRGTWSRWTELHAHGDHGPDGTGVLRGTDPVWTGPADLFQVRLRGDVRGLKARFVHARPGVPRARASIAQSRRRSQPGGAPRIITRAEWGGDGCKPRAAADYGEVQMAFVHHTVSANDYGPQDSAAIVLGICRYHRDSNRWNDLGYNFLVDKYGQVFEGRAGGIDRAVIGAQAQGYNSVSTGIACIGDFSAVAQSEAGLDALARLIAWKLSLHGVPVTGQVTVTSAGGSANRYPSGTPVTFERISGHRDGDRTSCPGDALYGQLAVLRERAASYAGPVSSISVKPAATSVRHGRAVAVTGTLRFSDGASPAGAPVEIQHQAEAGEWTTLARTTAAGDGGFSATVSPPATGLLRARYPGDGSRPALEASPARITVLAKVTLRLDPRRARSRTRIGVEGTVGPTWPSRAPLTVERRVGRRWVTVQRKRINVRGGRFKTAVRAKRPGLYRISIEVPGATVRRLHRATTGRAGVTGGASA